MKKLILIAYVVFGLACLAKAQPYSFGHQPRLGGFVISITADKMHGLVVETEDQAICKWNDIKNHINKYENHSYYGKEFSDWRLPTKDELMLIYANKKEIGGYFSPDYYWSSTVPDWAPGGAWWQRFSDGVQYVYTKENTFRVRAVRDF